MNTPKTEQRAIRTWTEAERDVRQRMPSVGDVARIAATLAAGKDIDVRAAERLCKNAVWIWEESARAVESRVNELTARERQIDEAVAKPAGKMKRYPASLDESLRVIVRGKKSDRVSLYRKFLRDKIQSEQAGNDATPLDAEALFDAVESIVEENRKDGFTREQHFDLADAFDAWRKTLPSAKARKAARARYPKPVDTLGQPSKGEQASAAQGASMATPGASKGPLRPKHRTKRRKQT